MTSFKTCIRRQRKDGFYPVYIRIVHSSKCCYIPTDKVVSRKGLTSSNEIKDAHVLKYCNEIIAAYIDRLNKRDISNFDINQIKSYLTTYDEDICFSDYARKFHDLMIDRGQIRNARNYELAYQHLERFAGTNKVMFSRFTSTFIEMWMKTLETTKRAKEMYPICIRQIYKSALLEYNDYDNNLIKIKRNPWLKIKITHSDRPQQLAISAEDCRTFFAAPLPPSKMVAPLEELGRDVAMMVMCLAGINTIDLFEMKKQEYYNGILHYKRKKTMKKRTDDAYIEMRIPAILIPIVEKYTDDDPNDEHLFNFYKRHTTSDSFSANVNIGIKKLCASMGIKKENSYCIYTFRHTWGTIAQNDCGASIADVAFAMNHSFGLNVTRGYLKIDFVPAWELNERVIDFTFFSSAPSKLGMHDVNEEEEDHSLRIAKKYLIKGEVFLQGRLLHKIEGIGFSNKDDIINELKKHVPEDVPDRSVLMFRIENKDKDEVGVYHHLKS